MFFFFFFFALLADRDCHSVTVNRNCIGTNLDSQVTIFAASFVSHYVHLFQAMLVYCRRNLIEE